jgi:hypothetical protein
MRKRIPFMLTLAMAFPLFALAQKTTPKDEPNSLVITFKDGRQKSFLMADVARVEVNTGKAPVVSKTRFLGKWKVGEGNGGSFYITLEQDGVARKSIGSSHGSWTVMDNEARITWDDGWHDAIRKNGARFEKAAFAPGKTFTDEPDNVTKAENTEAQPL